MSQTSVQASISGGQVAKVGDNLEEVLADGGVLFFLQAQACLCNAGEDFVGVGVGCSTTRQTRRWAGQCAGLGAFELGGKLSPSIRSGRAANIRR